MNSTFGALLVLLLAQAGCRCNDPEEASPGANPPAPAPAPRCVSASDASYRLEVASQPAAHADAFGVELGRALQTESHFVLPFLKGGAKQSSAGILWLERESLSAQVSELGPVHGDVAPPKVAHAAGKSVVALMEQDAQGGQYRLGAIEGREVRWFAELDEHGDDSPAFDLVLRDGAGVLVWDDWDRARNKGVIQLSVFSTESLEQKPIVQRASPDDRDVEMPRVLLRPGGFWLSWLALGAAVPAPASDEQGNGPAPLLASHASLELVQLDERGQTVSTPLSVTPPQGTVTGYDAIAAHDGSVLFAVREGGSASVLDGASVRLVRVAPDGSTHDYAVQAEDLGAAAPNLLFDVDPRGGAPHGWLALATRGGASTLAALAPFGDPLEPLEGHPLLGSAALLAAHRGRLLIAKPSGSGAVLGLVSCRPALEPADAGPR